MRTDLVGAWHLDIADTIAGGTFEIERTADELDHFVGRFADLAWPSARRSPRTQDMSARGLRRQLSRRPSSGTA
jgi:hypothetical protein